MRNVLAKDEVLVKLPKDGSVAIMSGSLEVNRRFYALIIGGAVQILDRFERRAKRKAVWKKRKK